jgi:hypothetical protein
VRRAADLLLAPEVALVRLNGDKAEEELDLVELGTSGTCSTASARPSCTSHRHVAAPDLEAARRSLERRGDLRRRPIAMRRGDLGDDRPR